MSEEWTRGASPEGLAALTAALEQEDPPACGAVHPEHPGTHCRQSGGHRGPHMTARRDVEWDNAYLSKPGTPAPAAPLGLDRERLAEAIDSLDGRADTNRIWRAMGSSRLADAIADAYEALR